MIESPASLPNEKLSDERNIDQNSNLELTWTISFQVREKKSKKNKGGTYNNDDEDKSQDDDGDDDDALFNFPIKSIESDLNLNAKYISSLSNDNSMMAKESLKDVLDGEEMKFDKEYGPKNDSLYMQGGIPLKLNNLASFKTAQSQLELKDKSSQNEKGITNESHMKFKKILKNVKGVARTGDFIGIVGPSGSGKSVFLKCLALRQTGSKGEIYLNKKPVDTAYFNMTALVHPDDNFFLTLTVEEHLDFQAVTRIPPPVLKLYGGKMKVIDEALENVQLSHAKKSLISCLSGGEKKRLSVATELLARPNIILCDEPTSGLDSHKAMALINQLGRLADPTRFQIFNEDDDEGQEGKEGKVSEQKNKNKGTEGKKNSTTPNQKDKIVSIENNSTSISILATPRQDDNNEGKNNLKQNQANNAILETNMKRPEKKRIVFAVIHQPSRDLLAKFNKVILFANGNIVYFGPTDKVHAYFTKWGYQPPPFYNIADFVLDTLSTVANTEVEREERLRVIQDIGHSYRCSVPYRLIVEAIDEARDQNSSVSSKRLLSLSVKPKTNIWVQFCASYKRAVISYKREPVLFFARFVSSFTQAALIGAIFWKANENPEKIRDVIGLIFVVVMSQVCLSMMTVANAIPDQHEIFQREVSAGANRPFTFYWALTLAEIPYQLLFPTIYGSIVYVMVGLLPDWNAFFTFWVLLVLGANAACSIAYFLIAIFLEKHFIQSITLLIGIIMSIYAGVLHSTEDIPPFGVPLNEVSMIRYSFQGMVINNYPNPIPGEIIQKSLGIHETIGDCMIKLLYVFIGFRVAGWIIMEIRHFFETKR